MAVWSGVEEQHFQLGAARFRGARPARPSAICPRANSVPAFLQARLARGQPPDVAFLPQPGLLRSYAAEHLLVPLDPAVARVVAQNDDPAWQQLGSADGRLYGVWFRRPTSRSSGTTRASSNVSASRRQPIWPGSSCWRVGERRGLAGLPAGGPAPGRWRTGRTCTWAGRRARYDLLAGHRIPWTDPTVKAALRLMAAILAPPLVAGGPRGALRVTYQESVINLRRCPRGGNDL